MPEFLYEGVDRGGKRMGGKVDAGTEGDVRVILRAQGVRPTKILKAGVLQADIGSLLKGGKKTLPSESVVTFTRQLHVLISSGIPLVQALDVLHEQAIDKNLKFILDAIKARVTQGDYLWQALSGFPDAFPKIYVALIRAGEASGAMDSILKRLSRYLEDAERIRKLVRGAMIYPVAIVCIGIAVIAILLTFVIPKFEELLKGSGQELPGPTQFVIDLSHFMVNNLFFVVGGVALVVYFGRRYIKSDEGRAFLHRQLFYLPLVGPLMQKSGTAKFSRTMQTLLTSGVTLVDAIDICRATVDNVVLEEAIGKIRGEVEAGRKLGTVVGGLGVFPVMATQMISVGESTGNLDKMLDKVADFYEMEVEALVGGLTKLIEPLILVFLGGSVGGLMIAMYLPIFKLAGGAGE